MSISVITSTRRLCFHVCLSVCLSVYLSIARISQKVWDQYRKFVEGLAIDQGPTH